jgi:hypothetical protein
MELTIPTYAKTNGDTVRVSRARRSPTNPAPRIERPARRSFGRLFRREEPSTFHRCLAVHMYYAHAASALE